ncbi:MAG: TetR/AcrR family transcriptional regulator [Parvibaculaceae bacterium]
MKDGFFHSQATGAGKRERTRAAMLDATVRLVAQKGMEALRINDVTDEAGLANGTFYNHFADKDEVLLEAAYGIAAEVSRQLDGDMTEIEDAPTRVVIATRQFINILLAEPDWAALLMSGTQHLPQLRDDASQYLRADLERGVAQGKFDIEVTGFLLNQIMALIAVAVTTQLHQGHDARLTDGICENILRLLGLAPAEAKQICRSV